MTTPPTAVALSSKVAPEPLQEADDDAAAQQQEQPRGFPWQRKLWAFLDDPASSKPAKFFSLLMMSVIITSVINFCLASIPYNCWWENGGLINETAINETDGSTYVVEYLAYDPVRMCDKMQDNAPIPFETIEMVCIILFTIEFLLRVVTCVAGPGFVGFFTGFANIIDVVAILPWYVELIIAVVVGAGGGDISFLSVLRIIRIFRVMRLFKMSKNMQGLMILARTIYKSATAMAMLVFFILITLIVFSTLMYNIEGPGVIGSLGLGPALDVVYDNETRVYLRPDGSPTPFESILSTMWYCIITMTTVGYGDAYPVTVIGQITAMLLMLFSLIVLALPITIIGANFDEEYRLNRMREMYARRKVLKDKQLAADVATKLMVKSANKAPLGNPIAKIQTLIRDSHARLTQDVELLMNKQENELREKIKVILKEHAEKVAAAPRQEPAPMPAMLIAAKTLASMPVAEVMRVSE